LFPRTKNREKKTRSFVECVRGAEKGGGRGRKRAKRGGKILYPARMLRRRAAQQDGEGRKKETVCEVLATE